MKNHSLYRFEQLAHMGLPEQIFIPALLQELHHEIGSLANTFCWQDDDGKLNNIYDESLNTVGISHFINAMSSSGPNKYSHTVEWVSQLDKATTTSDFFGECPHVGDFYKTILLPMGYRNSCFVPVICPDTGKRYGVLMVHRKKGMPDFNADDLEFLTQVANIIQIACLQDINLDIHMLEGWEKGVLIVDSKGILQHSCPMGLKLLALSSSSKFNQDNNRLPKDLRFFSGLTQLIDRLSNPRKEGKNASTISIMNAWGEFKLHAFLMDDLNNDNASQIALNISWQEPFVLKLFHKIKTLGLTSRQETVALFYAAGDQLQLIADKLSISLHTVKEHIRNISTRLNINSRAELVGIILCEKAFIEI